MRSKQKQPDWAKRLQAARISGGWRNPIDFAREADFSQQRYANYEAGIREPKIETWLILKEKLGISIDFIMSGDGSYTPLVHSDAKASRHRPKI